MIIASHRRSGTHFLIRSLELTFGKAFPLLKTHGLAEEVASGQARVEIGQSLEFVEAYGDQPILYIVRDPRDALTSNYHWWATSGESKCGGIAPSFRGVSPFEWLNGKVTLGAIPVEDEGCGVTQPHVERGIFKDPVGFWVLHVTSYLETGTPFVRYEDLLLKPRPTLIEIAKRFQLKRPWWPRSPRKLVGYEPRLGVIGDHRNLMTPEALAVIEEKAGSLMRHLGYQ